MARWGAPMTPLSVPSGQEAPWKPPSLSPHAVHCSSVHRPAHRRLVEPSLPRSANAGYLNRGEPFQTDMVTTHAAGERKTSAGLAWGVEGMRVGGGSG